MKNNLDPSVIGERILTIKAQRGCSITEAADDLFRDIELAGGAPSKPHPGLAERARARPEDDAATGQPPSKNGAQRRPPSDPVKGKT